MAPTPEKFQILIESILGGQSPSSHFAAPDQFRASLGMDPSWPLDDTTGNPKSLVASGLLRPTALGEVGGTQLAGAPLWFVKGAAGGTMFAYTNLGSVYAIPMATFPTTVEGLGDLNDGGTSSGNGAAYYDNYVYFSRDTTIARYGPLNGTPTFTDDYWVSGLGMTALTNSSYPVTTGSSVRPPNHVLHRHSDGTLYIADVVDNKGTIHKLSTSKTTVEGDTDFESEYDAVNVGYGLLPTAMESYGDMLVIAFVEHNSASGTEAGYINPSRAKVAFWDTTSRNVNKIVWVEFPDTIITAMKNVNGVLYLFSGMLMSTSNVDAVFSPGFRVTRYVGGSTFQDVHYSEHGFPPLPGAVEGDAERLLFGCATKVPSIGSGGVGKACVFSLGLQKSALGRGLFTVFSGYDTHQITALMFGHTAFGMRKLHPVIGMGDLDPALAAPDTGYVMMPSDVYTNTEQMFWSSMFRIGQPFQITKIRIPLAQEMAGDQGFAPAIYMDDGVASTGTIVNVNPTNYQGKRNIVIRPNALTGEHNFWLEIRWTGSSLCVVGLPITIEGHYLQD